MAFHMVRSNSALRGYMSLQKNFMRENHYEIRKQVHESRKNERSTSNIFFYFR